MTTQRQFKARVRARMEKTGERYAAARAALIGELHREVPPRARHDQTFALHRVLAAREQVMPWTNAAPDEAWLLGLGGGIGLQYFTFAYRGMLPIAYLGLRCGPQYAYDAAFLERAVAGLGMSAQVSETTSPTKAEAQLAAALADGPVIAWVGREALAGVAAPGGATPWVVVVHDVNGDGEERTFAIEDALAGPIELGASALARARSAVKKAKHRLLVPQGRVGADPASGVAAGIAWCAAELAGEHAVSGFDRNFGLAALEKWSKALRDSGAKGFLSMFAPGVSRLGAALQLVGWIEAATGGGGFRSMYAEFLRAAARVVGRSELVELAALADGLAARWSALADALLDRKIGACAELRVQIDKGGWPQPPRNAADLLAAVESLPPGWDARVADELCSRVPGLLEAETTFARQVAR